MEHRHERARARSGCRALDNDWTVTRYYDLAEAKKHRFSQINHTHTRGRFVDTEANFRNALHAQNHRVARGATPWSEKVAMVDIFVSTPDHEGAQYGIAAALDAKGNPVRIVDAERGRHRPVISVEALAHYARRHSPQGRIDAAAWEVEYERKREQRLAELAEEEEARALLVDDARFMLAELGYDPEILKANRYEGVVKLPLEELLSILRTALG